MPHRLCYALPWALVLALSACSSPEAPQPPAAAAPDTPVAHPAASASVELELGSPAWHAWINRHLRIDAAGPTPGSPAWNTLVQQRLGQEAPQAPLGSPHWQQAVDALVRTRTPHP